MTDGMYPTVNYTEMEDSLQKFDNLEPEERTEFQEAFQLASNFKMDANLVKRIQEGKFTTIPLGYNGTSPHAVDLVFYKGTFAICNRGDRMSPETIVMYKYDHNKLNLNVLQFLITNRTRPVQSGALHQHCYLYGALPLILGATRIEDRPHSAEPWDAPILSSHSQQIGNCAKASPMTAFKVGVYLKELEKIPLDDPHRREKAAVAKDASAALSFQLRSKMIHRMETYLSSDRCTCTPSQKAQIQGLCNQARKKLLKGTLTKVIPNLS